jgi:predicted Zn-dependent peptidase
LHFHEARLPNGLQIIAELSPSVYSVGMGFFVRTGSRDETSDVSGVSHFLEHMAFKGNEKYSADDVNRIFDEVGAKYNASTSEEITLFYGAVLPEYVPRTLDLLAGIIQPSLRQDDFDMEKNVILEEIGMYDDQPTFTAYEKLMQRHFAGHPLGQSILGSVESITALKSEQMRNYHHEHYRAGNITLAVAGNFDWQQVLDLAGQYCGHWPAGTSPRPVTEAKPAGGVEIITRETGVQQHVMQMAPAPSARDDRRFAAELLSVVIGDDSGSRMYWELVDPGHAESAELGYNEFDGSGVYLTYFSSTPEEAPANLARIREMYDKVNREGVSEAELSQAKNKICSRIVLRSERPMGRLSSLGNNWVYRGEYRSVQADLDAVQGVKAADIRALLDAYPLGQTTTVAIGPRETLDS